ncbi:MAG: hypothetical protein JJT85_07055 [Chromatiales bacterium]|nr:hypothetical protein [Chromatiales bacterium]
MLSLKLMLTSLLLLAAPVAVASAGTWSCTVEQMLDPSVVGGLDRGVVPERPGFRVDLHSGRISHSALAGFGTGELLRVEPGLEELWAAWWLVETPRGQEAELLRLAGEPDSGLLHFVALHRGQLYLGRCTGLAMDADAWEDEPVPFSPAPPPQAQLGVYYNCLAVYLHKLSADGLGGYRIDALETPRFQLDSRNGVLIGRMLEGFGRGHSAVQQPVPGRPWTAWWFSTAPDWPQVDLLYLLPRVDIRGQRAMFMTLHREWIISGLCSATERSGDYPPPLRR